MPHSTPNRPAWGWSTCVTCSPPPELCRSMTPGSSRGSKTTHSRCSPLCYQLTVDWSGAGCAGKVLPHLYSSGGRIDLIQATTNARRALGQVVAFVSTLEHAGTTLQGGASVFEGAYEGHDLAEGATGVSGGLDEIDSSAGRVQVGQHFPAQPAPDQSTVSW